MTDHRNVSHAEAANAREIARRTLIDQASDAPRLRDKLSAIDRLMQGFAVAAMAISAGAVIVLRGLPFLGVPLSRFQDGLLSGIIASTVVMGIMLLVMCLHGMGDTIEPKPPPAPVPNERSPASDDAAPPPGKTREDVEQLLSVRTSQVLGAHRGLRSLRGIARAGLGVGVLTACLFGPAAVVLWDAPGAIPGQRPLLMIAGTLIAAWNVGCLATLRGLRRLSDETLT